VYGYSAERKPIDVRIIRSVIEDRSEMGLEGDQLLAPTKS
jgi:hypothetical protein